ncbi:hypothetical protein O7632_20415 [Solwaraspora sp. WMMD406]|uniref:hypothetical protein n=1 Tax=Solwaraspora sp. WMMD406 TaxID=3016095 RepID=UPI0024178BEE|nr:hypothetical protein [Solwaraspora sp. WMMD406]MDG4766445.1 hypothetical protein [Solwaraspora sp. WMMD406]
MSIMALTRAQEQTIIRLLRKENRDKIQKILRTSASFLNWLADVIGAADEIYRRVRTAVADFLQDLRGLFR